MTSLQQRRRVGAAPPLGDDADDIRSDTLPHAYLGRGPGSGGPLVWAAGGRSRCCLPAWFPRVRCVASLMVLSRVAFYRGWCLGLALTATVVALAQHAPLTGELVWLWLGGGVGVVSERGSRGVRAWVDVLMGLCFLTVAVWSVGHLCGLRLTVSWGALASWMNLVPRPQPDLFPALLHGLLGMLAWVCALAPPLRHPSALLHREPNAHWPPTHP